MPFATDVLTGLSAAEARSRLEHEGGNELPAPRRATLPALALGVMREPMFALLIGAALIYLVIGDLGEALLLFGFATVSVVIAIVQQGRSERALEALRDLASPRALVIRDGRVQRIAGREVVRGDITVLVEGDRVPADGIVVQGQHIEVDESLLTGESVPVHKAVALTVPERMPAPVSTPAGAVFSGTLVVNGTGLAMVLATGAASAIGAIGGSLARLERDPPRLELETRRLVRVFGSIAFLLCVLTTLVQGLTRGEWLPALLGGIALGMALLPEEFPLVLTVYMAMGARRLSRSRVLTRRAAAIEALGAATVLCTDKTGTLTRNLMTVQHLECETSRWERDSPPGAIEANAGLAALLETALLASDTQRVDPMDRALGALEQLLGRAPRRDATLLREYPLRPERLALTRAWRFADSDALAIAAKGAPEAILSMCSLPLVRRRQIEARVDDLAARGVRVLAVARARFNGGAPPDAVSGFEFEYAGLLGFADPLRESVPEAVRECHSAGIRVVMITGDFPATARAIARQAGIPAERIMSGADVDALDDPALAAGIAGVGIFARISPIQKLRIVEAFKRNGEVVAMTGDGVNDAPALKSAHIGIAMGGRGTDVAREAASIVLLDDDFASIVRAIRQGRSIYDNLRKAMGYILAIHVPIAGLALAPLLFGWPLILSPPLIALLELIIDPACSIVLEAEPEERDIMNRPPRGPRSRLLSGTLVAWSLMQGCAALVVVCVLLASASAAGLPDATARTVAFLALIAVNVALIFANRTFAASLGVALGRPNRVLWWGIAAVLVAIGALVAWPAARGYFNLGAPSAPWLISVPICAFALLALLEVVKRFWRRGLIS